VFFVTESAGEKVNFKRKLFSRVGRSKAMFSGWLELFRKQQNMFLL
jgi:hypothetical protein